MLPHAPSRPLRRLLRWTTWTVATLVLVVLLGFLYVTFVGISVDASFLRTTIAQTFSANLGRTVRFEGPMEMEISATPKLRIGGLHIANAPGFGDGDFASLGEARLAVDLWPLLFKRKLHIDELAGSDVRARLQVKVDGSNNWTFHRPKPAVAEAREPASPSSISVDQAFTLLDIKQVSLQNLKVEYVGVDGKSHYFSLHALTAQSPADQPFKMNLNGTVENEFPYRLDFTGGKLADLATDKPWPIAFTLSFLSSTLTLSGSVSGSGSGELTFGLGTENLLEFERLLQIDLPDVGASGIAGTVNFTPRRVAITQLAGAMGNTTLIGALDFDNTGSKPKLSGSLTLPALDLRPFLKEKSVIDSRPEQNTEPPRSFAEVYRSLSTATFDLRRMNSADADLTLGVGRWLSLPGDAKDVSLQIKLKDGLLHVPITASIAGVALAGSAGADANASPPVFKLALGARNSDLGGLAELLLGVPGVKGHLGRFNFKLSAQGAQGKELVRSMNVRLEVERGQFSYGNVEGGRPVEFGLRQLVLDLPAGEPLNADMRGALLGHPFTARLHAGALEPTMLQGRTPLDFQLRSGEVHARIRGALEAPTVDRGPDLAFEFSAPHAGELASWFGFQAGAQAPAALSGKASLRERQWQLQDLLFRLGRTTISANLTQSMVQGKPLLKVQLGAEQIDVKELESMIPKSGKKKTAPERPVLDIPLLPQGIDLTDADIAVRIKRFVGAAIEARDVSFDGKIRDGYMHPSPFAANVADTAFNGAVLFDLRSAEPMAGLWLFAPDINVGNLLRKLGVVKNLEATFSDFALNLVARSSRLGDMLARSQLLGSIGGGRIVLRDPNTQGEARITVDKGELRADPGTPLRLSLQGALDDVSVSIELDTARADQLADPRLPFPFKLHAQAADSRVLLSGNIARPIGSEIELTLDAGGTRFDKLNKLARASLPPWGPWSANGKFRMSPRGYEVNHLRLQVGESRLDGQGRLDTEGGRPRVVIALSAPIIQLDDFKLGEWSPIEKKPDDKLTPLTADEIRSKAALASDQAQKLLSPEMLRRQDASLIVEVNQVLSGKDKLGSGKLEARLENGRADIGPIVVDTPGGSAKLQLGYEPTEQDVKVDLHIDVRKFDYGVLARRIKPESDLRGAFSLRMDVDSRARYLSEILRHGSGRIEFAVWPQNMKAGVFDLWAVNVLVALVPAVDPGKASKVNCAIGRFELSDGKLIDRIILLDTNRMRVTGKGQADFKEENFDLRMRPQAKTAQFLSLATPIQISGPFNNFKIGVSAGDIIGTVGRLATSIFWVPLQKLAGKKIPTDGSDVCFPDFSVGSLTLPASG
ncbi:MAG: AsmA family protein [Prolixibacteraceae bacterium]|nr:AsmA family protein [Burkholderiales bacterium]